MKVLPYTKFENRCWQIHDKIIRNNQRIKQLIKQNRCYYSYIREYSRNYHFKEPSFDKAFAAIVKKRTANEDDNWVFQIDTTLFECVKLDIILMFLSYFYFYIDISVIKCLKIK